MSLFLDTVGSDVNYIIVSGKNIQNKAEHYKANMQYLSKEYLFIYLNFHRDGKIMISWRVYGTLGVTWQLWRRTPIEIEISFQISVYCRGRHAWRGQ